MILDGDARNETLGGTRTSIQLARVEALASARNNGSLEKGRVEGE